ncbi:GSCFA domain-containing protein [Paraflavisolibacter sp. H34]
MLDLQLPKAEKLIHHQHRILSIGSCFTEHIGKALMDLKFNVLQNPNGILFDPASVCSSLVSYIKNKPYTGDDLFYLNEVWQSWQHHSRFSGTDRDSVVAQINQSQQAAHDFLLQADWVIITLGSSFSYRLTSAAPTPEAPGSPVANCHRAPAQWFQKYLMPISETVERLDNALHQLFYINPKVNIIFTISPVRHIRDGVVENNRSKARLLEAVHHMVNKFARMYYFPSYEIVIDILRDYRFYDIDMVHPNYLATDFVLKKFLETYTSEETGRLLQELRKIAIARRHRPTHAATDAHRRFLQSNLEKATTLQNQFPELNLGEEIAYFSGELG